LHQQPRAERDPKELLNLRDVTMSRTRPTLPIHQCCLAPTREIDYIWYAAELKSKSLVCDVIIQENFEFVLLMPKIEP
jgi:hypothetical protein